MAETSKTVHQALLVLGTLSTDGPGTATDLGRRLDISRTVVHRLLVTFEEHGFVRRTKGRFELGFGILELAAAIEPGLRAAARPALIGLVDEFDETAVLSIRDGEEVVAVDQVVADGRVVQVRYRRGLRRRLGEAASGACLLAFDPAEHRPDLDTVRRAGYALSDDELEVGVSGLAAPVFDGAGVATAAIGVVAPTARMPSPADLAPSVVAAADAVSGRLASQWSRTPGPGSVGA